MPGTDRSADEAAVVRLERALLWRAAGGVPVRPVASALLCQALVMWTVSVAIRLPGDRDPVSARPAAVTRVFTVPPEAASRPVSLPTPGLVTAAPASYQGDFPKAAPDLSAIELRFADDVGGRLPDVLQQQHGVLALLDKQDPTIARYLFQPPAWQPRDAGVDVSSMLCLWMDPPEAWAVFRALAQRHGIALDRYRAAALFDIGYRRCLQDAIGRAAATLQPGGSARVLAARLAFAADLPCGVQVLDVSLGDRLVRQPL